jgi:hypothetical protein
MRRPPENRRAAATAIATDANRKIVSATTLSKSGTKRNGPHSYVLTAAAIDRIAERNGMLPREFVEGLLRSGLAECEGDGLRVWPGGRP